MYFFIWAISEANLERFLKERDGFHRSIKFTFEKLKTKVNFLAVVIKVKNGRISTELYFKPVDRHQYLHYISYHPELRKKSFIYSQTLRLRRICSGWFYRKSYPHRIVEEHGNRAFRIPLKHDT